jgi:hypothetical protein
VFVTGIVVVVSWIAVAAGFVGAGIVAVADVVIAIPAVFLR